MTNGDVCLLIASVFILMFGVFAFGGFRSVQFGKLHQNTPEPVEGTEWESINCPNYLVYRSKTPDGWLIITNDGAAYVPDSQHEWGSK